MILDLTSFLLRERPYWEELEALLDRWEVHSVRRAGLKEIQRFTFLAERAAADLVRLRTFSAEEETRLYLETLVGRAYAEMHAGQDRRVRWEVLRWLWESFPQAFRRHAAMFRLAVATMLAGTAFGAFAVAVDPEGRSALMPFSHLLQDPSERVAEEEKAQADSGGEAQMRAAFSAQLMTHNTKVAIFTLACGMTLGLGTLLLLFYNGVILGAVIYDYLQAGEGLFLTGWLLPHGSVEIPAILIAGQAGLLIGKTLIGGGERQSLAARLRGIRGDLVCLIGGTAGLLVVAGLVESFFSQYHEPVLPYEAKVAYGAVQLTLLALFLGLAGKKREAGPKRGTQAI